MKKLQSLFVFIMLAASTTFAQQDVQFTNYMHNKVTINPAYAGTHGVISATGLFRKQWVSMPGAPSSQSFNIHSPLRNENVGVGLSLINDRIGVTDNFNIYGAYSYKVVFDEHHDIHFGLQAGLTHYSTDFAAIQDDIKDQDDVKFDESVSSGVMPNFGFGMYYFTDHYYLGVSIPQFINNTVNTDGGVSVAQQARHYFVTGGFVYNIHENWKIRPAMMFKFTTGAPMIFDISNNFIYKEKYWIGASYRTGDSFDLMAFVQITEQLKFGYAYDFTVTELGDYNTGTHEVVLNYRFSFSKGKIITPRYF